MRDSQSGDIDAPVSAPPAAPPATPREQWWQVERLDVRPWPNGHGGGGTNGYTNGHGARLTGERVVIRRKQRPHRSKRRRWNQLRQGLIDALPVVMLCVLLAGGGAALAGMNHFATRLAEVGRHAANYRHHDALQRLDDMLQYYPDNAEIRRLRDALAYRVESSKPQQKSSTPAPPIQESEEFLLAKLKRISDDIDVTRMPDRRLEYMEEYLQISARLLRRHPNHLPVWLMRAQIALTLDRPGIGIEAGRVLMRQASMSPRSHPALGVLIDLDRRGWLSADTSATEGAP